MSLTAYKFIDPRTLAALGSLQLVARTVVEGFMFGSHRSPKTGAGAEFSQYRSYQPGDDLRRLDWKVLGRSDRYFIREAEIESSIGIRIVLDSSASMAHEEDGISKFDYARYAAAALAWLAHEQGDALGLLSVNSEQRVTLSPKADHQHLHRVLHELERLTMAGQWPAEQINLGSNRRREMLVVLTDLHEVHDELRRSLADAAAQKNEVLVFHILGERERTLAFENATAFRDLESGRVVEVDSKSERQRYSTRFAEHFETIRGILNRHDIDYAPFALQQPLDFMLRRFLKQRMKLV